jgi:hypothetical protein
MLHNSGHQFAAYMAVGIEKSGFTAFLPLVMKMSIVNIGFIIVNVYDLCFYKRRLGRIRAGGRA